jgi:hypothetical protein
MNLCDQLYILIDVKSWKYRLANQLFSFATKVAGGASAPNRPDMVVS